MTNDREVLGQQAVGEGQRGVERDRSAAAGAQGELNAKVKGVLLSPSSAALIIPAKLAK